MIRRLNNFKGYDSRKEAARIPLLDRIKKKVMFEWIIPWNYREKMTMKLSLFFIAMDLLTLLAYPILFVHGRLRQFSHKTESIALTSSLAMVLVVSAE